MSNVIWIDTNIDNFENSEFGKHFESMKSIKLKLFKNLNEAIAYLKSIKFEETKIIVSGRLYGQFVQSFKANLIDMCICPKIIVFTSNIFTFNQYNPDYQSDENKFYNYGGITVKFRDILKFLENDKNNKIDNTLSISPNSEESRILNETARRLFDEIGEKLFIKSDDAELIFDYIDRKEKLILPLFFKTLIDNVINDNMEQYTKFLFNTYCQNKNNLKQLFGSIESMENIPIEILSKYYARLYTEESDFYKDLNKDLRLNKKDKYLPYIKTLYEGVKLKSLPLASKNILYRGGKLSNEEISKIENHKQKKIKDLPSSIVFSKSFLSFTKDEKIAERFLNYDIEDEKFSKVLFILEKDDNLGYNLATHGDIENISFNEYEKEVLFFPFSSFAIKEIKEKKLGKYKRYEIRLLYLGKYLNEIEDDKNIIINENKIPESEFKKQLTEFGLIKKEKIENINPKTIIKEYKEYEKEINNFIKGEINIGTNNINEDVQIINSFENVKKEINYKNTEDDWIYENENEIKENIQIKINDKEIGFSYCQKFEKEGIYKIEYTFKKYITKGNHLFYDCNCLINLDLSNFNTKYISNMNYMFFSCKSLKNLDLSNFNTQNVTNMSCMFNNCYSLVNLNLSSFNTNNVTDMSFMFNVCNSLVNLDLSNFNTKNVTNMSHMFNVCNSLVNLDLSNFETKNVTDMSYMFNGCSYLVKLNLSNFNTLKVSEMSGMFYVCDSLKKENVITKDKRILSSFD